MSTTETKWALCQDLRAAKQKLGYIESNKRELCLGVGVFHVVCEVQAAIVVNPLKRILRLLPHDLSQTSQRRKSIHRFEQTVSYRVLA